MYVLLLNGDILGSLQANNPLTIYSISLGFKFCPFLIDILLAKDFEIISVWLKLSSGISLLILSNSCLIIDSILLSSIDAGKEEKDKVSLLTVSNKKPELFSCVLKLSIIAISFIDKCTSIGYNNFCDSFP